VRIPPNSPFSLTNLALSTTGVPLWIYVLGTAVGMLPRTALVVWLASRVEGEITKEAMAREPGMLGVSIAVALAALLARHGPLPEPQVRDIAEQVAAGLEAAHRESVIHRDLKPSNLQLVEGDVRIVDFGIARTMDGEVGLDEEGRVLGSPLYMSPEQIRGGDLDGRSDLYSLGVVLFTCLAGREPFQGVTVSAVSLKHLQDPPPELRRLRPDVGRPLAELIGRLLAKDPADRPATAGEVVAELRSISDDPLA